VSLALPGFPSNWASPTPPCDTLWLTLEDDKTLLWFLSNQVLKRMIFSKYQ